MKHISIGSVKIPFDDYVTQGTAILGIRGAGKTYTAKGIAEQMLDAKVPIIVFDAIGVWRYLKIAADAQGKAYKVVVAGGKQPDLPLSPHSAPQIIRAALRENIPLIVDLYDTKLSKADWRRIVQECFRIMLYENQGLRHIFLEEAAEYVPQRVTDGQTFAEVEKLVRMGGNASLGITIINQRSQELNKSVLELCDNLVMMRQKGFNAIAYAEKWAERLSPEQAKQIGQKLPKMEAGDCWVFTDAHEEPVFTRSEIIRSFHPDRKRPEHPKNSSIADPTEFVQKLSSELVHVIEEAKANDPAELKRTIADLRKQLAKAPQPAPAAEPVKILVLDDEAKELLKKANFLTDSLAVAMNNGIEQLSAATVELGRLRQRVEGVTSKPVPRTVGGRLPSYRTTIPKPVTKPRPLPASNGSLSKMERAILAVLDAHGECNIGKLALLAGYTKSGSFMNSLSSLRSQGLIQGENQSIMEITEEGRSHGPFPSLPSTSQEKFNYWINFPHFSRMEREILSALWHSEGALTKDEIAQAANYEIPVSGSFMNSLSSLRTAGVIVGKNSETMSISPTLLE